MSDDLMGGRLQMIVALVGQIVACGGEDKAFPAREVHR